MDKGIVLFSGGLDSLLAARILLNQSIQIALLTYLNPFIPNLDAFKERVSTAARNLDVPLTFAPMGDDYLDLVRDPPHGYGSTLNPCIDCRIYQFIGAKKRMVDTDASFLATGEVVGQRPMSQRRNILRQIDKAANVLDLVVRPLSARLLDPTRPEQNGTVDRQALLDIQGRSRKRQMQLADELGIESYPSPAGGCLLTDPQFCGRLKDLFDHCHPALWDIDLLKAGRHFRTSPTCKIVVGRDETENARLRQLRRPADVLVEPRDFTGPDCLVRGNHTAEIRHLACRLALRYSHFSKGTCRVITPDGSQEIAVSDDLTRDDCDRMRVGG